MELPTEAVCPDARNCLWNVADCRNACRLLLARASSEALDVLMPSGALQASVQGTLGVVLWQCKACELFQSCNRALHAEC